MTTPHTRCKHGHPLTGDNVRVVGRGSKTGKLLRLCLICVHRRQQERRARYIPRPRPVPGKKATCRNGHPPPVVRDKRGRCLVCVKECKQRTYAKHLERTRAKDRARRAANREVYNRRAQAWREKNPEKMRAMKRRWYANNRERFQEQQRRYAARNPLHVKLLKQRSRLDRVARQRAATGSHTIEDLLAIHAAQRGRCRWCSKPIQLGHRDCTIDHIVALTRGGSHNPENIALACKSCNCRKSNRDALVFLASR